MGYFPFFIDIEGKDILVVGGGKVALRKVEKLLPFCPNITVVSPKICDEITQLGVQTVLRKFSYTDLDDKFCVICATDDEAVNSHVFELCRERGILVNTVDDKEKCSFIFPALSGGADVTVGISTSGKSPLFARFLRENIDQMLGGSALDIAELLGRFRPKIKREFADENVRKAANEALLEMCLDGRLPTDDEIYDMLGRIKKSYENTDRNEEI